MINLPPVKKRATPTVKANNLAKPSGSATKPLHFKINAELHQEIKTFAAANGLKLVDLLKLMFEHYKRDVGHK